MPEGDTIYRTATSLRRWLGGREITAARTRVPGLDARRLVGHTIDAVDTRGKHLLIRLSGGEVLHTHMMMTGSWHVYPTGERWRRSAAQARLVIEAGSRLAVCFNAPVIELLAAADEAEHRSLGRLGPDVLDPGSLDWTVVRRRARERTSRSLTIGELLLDQQVVAGIGNIYRCESLFLCGINPARPTAEVSDRELQDVIAVASRLMMVNAGVSPASTSGPVSPGASAIARDFDAGPERTWVYGRAGRPCRRCGTLVRTARLGVQARTVYWCPTCQPAA
jgi:endonuclease-8